MKAALIPLYHSDYPFERAASFLEEAVHRLKRRKLEVLVTSKVSESSETRRVAREVLNFDPDAVIFFVLTWIEAPAAVSLARELSSYPMIVWGLRMYYESGRRESTGSLPGAAVLKASLEAVGYRPKFVVGLPDEAEALDDVYRYCLVASAVKKLSRSKIGLVGYASMGMYTAMFDPISMRSRLGVDVVHIDTSSIFKELHGIKEDEALKAVEGWKKKYFIESDVREEDLFMAAKIYLVFKKLVEELRLEGLTVKCQYEFSKDLGFVPCVPISVLADEGVVCSCEGDVPLTVTMLVFHYLTKQPIYYGDLVDIRDNRVYLSSCGFAPLSLSASPKMGIGVHKYFFKGLRSGIVLREGEVTLARLGVVRGEYRMHVALGKIVETELRQGLFPAAEIELKGDINAFIENVMSQHYALAYGDLRSHLRALCDMVKVKYIET